jgi:hypothetical protein
VVASGGEDFHPVTVRGLVFAGAIESGVVGDQRRRRGALCRLNVLFRVPVPHNR